MPEWKEVPKGCAAILSIGRGWEHASGYDTWYVVKWPGERYESPTEADRHVAYIQSIHRVDVLRPGESTRVFIGSEGAIGQLPPEYEVTFTGTKVVDRRITFRDRLRDWWSQCQQASLA